MHVKYLDMGERIPNESYRFVTPLKPNLTVTGLNVLFARLKISGSTPNFL